MNPTLLAIWRWLATFWSWLFLRFHFYQYKSYLHRYFWDREYDGTPLTVYATVNDLREWIAKQTWVADNWTELWDAVCTPQKVQAVGQGAAKEGDVAHDIGDCDEFAIYITNAIEVSLAAGQMKELNIANPRFFTVTWMTPDGKPEGHNVCLLERPQTDGTVKFSFMDYGMPSIEMDTPAQVAVYVAQHYCGEPYGSVECGVLVWCVSDCNLKPLKAGWGDGWVRGAAMTPAAPLVP